jgi:hypothetical protein
VHQTDFPHLTLVPQVVDREDDWERRYKAKREDPKTHPKTHPKTITPRREPLPPLTLVPQVVDREDGWERIAWGDSQYRPVTGSRGLHHSFSVLPRVAREDIQLTEPSDSPSRHYSK